MRVFVTGADGFIGSAVTARLMQDGHTIVGLAHSNRSAGELAGRGIMPFWGDLEKPETLVEAVRQAEAVIHLGAANGPNFPATDAQAVSGMLAAMAGTGKTFLYTSGISAMGDTGTQTTDETMPRRPDAKAGWRGVTEENVLAYAHRGVRALAIRPAIVYGHGRGGFVQFFLQSARQYGTARTIGTGEWRWSTVFVDDIADLYARVLENGKAGEVYIAASEESLSLKQIAEAASRAAGMGGKTTEWPVEEARKAVGLMADLMTANAVVSGAKARRELGWNPQGPTLMHELSEGAFRLRAPLIQTPEERKSWGVPGEIFTFMARSAETNGAYALMQVTLGGEVGPPPHVHPEVEESFYVLEGEVDVFAGEQTFRVGAGGYANIPKGTVHRFKNAGAQTAKIVTLMVPGGLDNYFEAAGEPVSGPDAPMPTNKDDLKRLAELGPKYGITFVQPQ